ncbi:MAG: carboxylating nicotinate-nucleotide diphosphorylase [Clostridiales Family XIII bacterium]|jgi:nicotinate-nucleotide pyrophosphorylase (carboxylating)|nr:carboxylating nicotinate-nucleotide diphosphorylase [Clostridiales Family XIII bacterium]
MNKITQLIHVDEHILMALREDISCEDISTNSVINEAVTATAELICKEDGVIAGLSVFKRVFELLDADFSIEFSAADGDAVQNKQVIGILKGDIRAMLSGERTALNYLQRMSGIATYTSKVASLLQGSGVKLVDTRKTTPGMRVFEKYAVKVGGGGNHRYNLSDCVMLKDNHVAAAGGIKPAIERARAYAPFVTKVEVEVESLEQLLEAIEAGADIIMLDNMDVPTMKEAVSITNGRAILECSGNVTKENISGLLDTGVDYISSGALTHSAPILDLSLKNLRPLNE